MALVVTAVAFGLLTLSEALALAPGPYNGLLQALARLGFRGRGREEKDNLPLSTSATF